ncbi:hypothetical protein J3R30DRAFT_3220561, partial [Lentinula aciculospora]
DQVWLTTWHCYNAYKAGAQHAAKFLPCFDDPYRIVQAHLRSSFYTLAMPNQPNVCPSFHMEHLKCFVPNDSVLFPRHEHSMPEPTIVDSQKEFVINRILD